MKPPSPDCALVGATEEGGEVDGESLLAAFCPAFPWLCEQIFRLQSVALMSLGSQDYRSPGVREQGWGFFIIIGRASLCNLQVAAGRQSLTEEGCGGHCTACCFQGASSWGWGPHSWPGLSFPSLSQLLSLKESW